MQLPNHEFFRAPTRISRLYPVLSLILLLVGSASIYRWQLTQINADTTVQRQQKEIESLTSQVKLLTAAHELDSTTLETQGKELKETSSKLSAVQTQLDKATNDLVAKEKTLAEAEARLKQQQGQLDSNASELQQLRARPPLFSFQNESNLADADVKEADIKSVVTSAYDYIQNLYGQPYLLNQITITFVNQFSIAASAGEISIENSSKGISINIHLKDFNKSSFQDNNTLIHEIIHGFHGIAVHEESALEEGETVAATDAVMERMIADGKLPKFSNLYLTITPTQYDSWNKQLKIYSDNTAFYQSSDVSKIYQVIGYAWMKLYREDANFFQKFNEAYYAKVQQGIRPTQPVIMDAIKATLSTVGSQSISSYLSTNQAFNPS